MREVEKILRAVTGQDILLDDDVFERVRYRKWYTYGRAVMAYDSAINGKQNMLCLHRVVIGAKSGDIVDHINHNVLDNRRVNLRLATQAQNGANRSGRNKNNTSGYRGVSWYKPLKKWYSYLRINGERKYLGVFTRLEDAARVVKTAREKYFGEFAGEG